MRQRINNAPLASSCNYDAIGQRFIRKMRKEHKRVKESASNAVSTLISNLPPMPPAEWEGLRYRLFSKELYVTSSEMYKCLKSAGFNMYR